MEIRIGPPATGQNFHKRPALIAKLLRALRRGNVAFLGPRRTGKTSCLEEIKTHPHGFLPILLNLERHDTVEAWLASMVKKLREELQKPQPHLSWAQDKVGGFLERLCKIEIPVVGGIELSATKSSLPGAKPLTNSWNCSPTPTCPFCSSSMSSPPS